MKLKITLNSDLCAASGDGFSGSIDTDVCQDAFGLPIIPSRRLKGCLRETALLIGTDGDTIDGLFGKTGDTVSGSLLLSDAHILRADEIDAVLERCSGRYGKYKVLELFTSIRASTRIEGDTAAENSLRFTRVVNKISPLLGDNLCFTADVSLDERYRETFADICRALHHIGYNRSRGLGAVRCEFLAEPDKPDVEKIRELAAESEGTIQYTVQLKDCLVIPQETSNETADYVPGTAVLGFFASKLKEHPLFEPLFLQNHVTFSNLYIADCEGNRCTPIPSFVAKIKQTGQIVNALCCEKEEDQIPKPLKHGYISPSGKILDVKTEIVYHHSTMGEKVLYTQRCLSAGQCFSGTISGSGRLLEPIRQVMEQGIMTLGRSKTAQYAKCSVVSSRWIPKKEEHLTASAGIKLAYVLQADAMLLNENAVYTTNTSSLLKALELSGIDATNSLVKSRTVGGYNAKWNHKKPQIRAYEAGTTLVFDAATGVAYPKERYFGEKTGEGFGLAHLYRISELIPKKTEKSSAVPVVEDTTGILRLLEEREQYEKMRSDALNFARQNKTALCKLNAAFIGRILRMIEQSEDYNNLLSRVKSVKSDAKRQDVLNLIKQAETEHYRAWYREYLLLIFDSAKYNLKQEGMNE